MKVYREKRAWGGFDQFTHHEKSTVKILEIKPGQRFSLQYHHHRAEFWEMLDNPAKVTIGKRTVRAKKGDRFFIKKGTLHRIEAGSKSVRVLEISFGAFKENDIVRIEDDYGRVTGRKR